MRRRSLPRLDEWWRLVTAETPSFANHGKSKKVLDLGSNYTTVLSSKFVMKRSPCSSPENSEVKTRRVSKYYKQAYRKEWESMPDFKGWLTEVVGHPQRAYCTVCAKSLHAHRLSLLKHTVTLKHTTAALKNYTQGTVEQYEVPSDLLDSEPSSSPISTAPSPGSSLAPLISSNASKGSLPMKVRAKQPNAAVMQNVKEERAHPEATDNETLEKVTSESVICDVSNVKSSSKIAESENSEEETNENPQTSSSANNTREKSLPVDHPEPVPRTPPIAVKESLASKAGKPVTEYPISTHVLDTAKGTPVGNLHVSLYKLVDGRWTSVGEGVTTPDGRCNSFVKRKDFLSGRYKIHFDVDRYFEIRKQDSLYPFIEIVFDARSSMEHYHIPLLVSPFGYTTYRGT